MSSNELGFAVLLTFFARASLASAAEPLPAAPPAAPPAPMAPAAQTAPTPTPADPTPAPTAPPASTSPTPAAPSASPEPAASTAPSRPAAPASEALAPAAPAPQFADRVAAAEPARDVAAEPDDGRRGSHQLHFYAGVGLRGSFIQDTGYEPFSKDSGLAQFSAMFGRILVTDSALSFGLSAAWDYGMTSATVRDAPTELSIHRVTLMPEIRYHLVRRLYAFARVGAGVALLEASYSDEIVDAERTADQASFTADPALGVAFEVFGAASGKSRQPRFWLLADAGYLFTSKMDLVLSHEAETPARTQPLRLGELGLSGATLRGMAALTF